MPPRTQERLFVRTERQQLTWPPPADTSVFRAADPVASLRAHVAKIRWGHEWIPPEAPVEERIVPDGTIHLLFVFSNASVGRPYGLVIGASSEPSVVRLSGHIEHVEVELLPGAAPALLGVPAGAVGGRTVALEDLWRDRATSVRDRLLESREPTGRVRIVQQALASALGDRVGAPPGAVREALRRIAQRAGDLRVGRLAADLGITDRRLEQLFQTFVGLSPKAACRLARLRATVDTLAAGAPPGWAELALARGFSDQSHLVNEFRALTGLSPREFQQRAGFGFLQDRRARGR